MGVAGMLTYPRDILCGYYDCANFRGLTFSPERTVELYEIELFLSGGDTTFLNGTAYRAKEGNVLIARPGQKGYSRIPFRTFYVKFRAEGDLAARLDAAPVCFAAVHAEKIGAAMQELILLRETRGTDDLLFAGRLLCLLDLVLSDAEIPAGAVGPAYGAVSRAKRYIEENYARDLSLAGIAQEVNFSGTHFHRLFSAAVGMSPHEYLMQVRIGQAKRMLWDRRNSLCEIAAACGFGCQQYMTRVFRRYTGMTPGAYRKLEEE